MIHIPGSRGARAAIALLLAACAMPSHADSVTDWNVRANQVIVDARMGTPPAVRLMAIVQTAVHNAVSDIDRQSGGRRDAAQLATIDAAVAAANRTVLVRAFPVQQAQVQAMYQAAIATLTDGPAREAGIGAGERAAAAVLAARADDGAGSAEAYRPHTSPGAYVPTVTPAVPQWPQRKPWLLETASQFRPGPPPATTSELWARDFNEVKAFGGRASTGRSAEEVEIARFWDFSLPAIYHGVVQSVAATPGRDVLRNARLFAVVSQAMDDALISVMDAKYHYNYWRPVTAIRNADIDGNDATMRDPSWMPRIDTPMHPEYPCAHCILGATVATLVQAEVGKAAMPVLATTSATAKGATRRWASPDALMREVALARIVGGVHFRNSTDIGIAMGRRIGELAALHLADPAQ